MSAVGSNREEAAPDLLAAREKSNDAVRTGRKVQVALDMRDLPTALAALRQVSGFVDVIEVGTILCLSEGMRAVSAIGAAYPNHLLLADIRIAEAGSLLATLAYDAGADWVTVVSGAAPDAFEAVAHIALERDRDVQVELSDGWTWETVQRCRQLGIRQFIFHRSRDSEALGKLAWSQQDLDAIDRVHRLGGRVSVTGGMTPAQVGDFAQSPVEIFIAGRALYASADPAASAKEFAAAVTDLPGIDIASGARS